MSVKDDCERCTDDQICRKHFMMGVALVAAKTTPKVEP